MVEARIGFSVRIRELSGLSICDEELDRSIQKHITKLENYMIVGLCKAGIAYREAIVVKSINKGKMYTLWVARV